MSHGIAIIIPAAGMSKRQPPNKLLLRLKDRTVIETTVECFIDEPVDIFVVIGHQKSQLRTLLNQRFGNRITIIENPRFKTGMASSLKAALVDISVETRYIGVCPGDKPFIAARTIRRLIDKLTTKNPLILAPSYEEAIGHPVFFAISLKAELAAISGDEGGRSVMQKHLEETTIIPVPDAGVVRDMDAHLENHRA